MAVRSSNAHGVGGAPLAAVGVEPLQNGKMAAFCCIVQEAPPCTTSPRGAVRVALVQPLQYVQKALLHRLMCSIMAISPVRIASSEVLEAPSG
jgi:hypothetical protein